MKDISRVNHVKFINFAILLTPISFLFHYIETSLYLNGSTYAFIGAFLFIFLAGKASVKIKTRFIIIISFLSILLSVVLGNMFIIPPNKSWFNPFGMNFAIIFVGIIILIGILVMRLFASKLFK